jgi:excinuclease ABC subunit B
MSATLVADVKPGEMTGKRQLRTDQYRSKMDQTELLELLRKEMVKAAEALEFEKAAELRDEINRLSAKKKDILNQSMFQ